MSRKPLVALVGRPNVGKSTLFNRIAGKRISIVEDYPGVTRDRLYADAEWCGYSFTMIDTGGIELKSDDIMWKHIREQAEIAVELADVIVFITDGREGIVQNDYDVADYLRRSNKPIVLAVNKIDTPNSDAIYEFYGLGLDQPYAVSAEQALGIGDILDAIVLNIEKLPEEEEQSALRIAIVGKPNAGKSSLVNKLLGYDRVIVSDIAGTTRDAIDTSFSYEDKNYILVDTAGIRRKRSVDEGVEQYSVMRSLDAIRRADIVLVVVDTTEMMTEQDVRLCGYVHEQGKPSVIVMNKWDLVEKDTHTMNKFKLKLDEELKFMDYYIPMFLSALTGKRVDKIMETALYAYNNSSARITTGVLNDVVMDAVRMNEPSSRSSKRIKFYYATEVSVNPPTFIFFVNSPMDIHFSYKRYLENSLRKAFDFKGTPIRLIFRGKDEE